MIRFLLAKLHLNSLVGKRSPKAIRTALAMLPKGSQAYDEAYKEAMVRIESQIADSQELAKQALSWITCATRPLTSTELRYALAVEINSPEFDDQNLTEIADILNVCAGLVTVEENSDIVRLIHYTTQEYFERTWHSWFDSAENDITETCITYLSLDRFAGGFCRTDEVFECRLRSNPLYDYAARNWGHHAKKASLEARQIILDFLGNENILSGCTQAMMMGSKYTFLDYSQAFPKQFTGVHSAAHWGLTDIIAALLVIGHNPNTKDSKGRTPMAVAAMNGHVAVVKLLAEQADVNAGSKDRYGQTPLSWAARNGHDAVVKFLVEQADVEVDFKDRYGLTPLSRAALNGHEAVVKLLVNRPDVDADSKDQDGQTPLSLAAMNGHEAVVKLLVDRSDVDADFKDQDGQTPLSWAAINGHEAVVKLLVDRADVDANSKDQDGQTPLSLAAQCGQEAVVKLLVDRPDVDADSNDRDGQTPLSLAAHYRREAVVKLLANRSDVDVNFKDRNGWTPPSRAAKNGYMTVVKLLVEPTSMWI
jgi:ankyrin repeat protein